MDVSASEFVLFAIAVVAKEGLNSIASALYAK